MPGVIFDFDGVLADTEHLHWRAFQEVLRVRGWTLDERVYFDRYLGYDDRGVLVAFARDQHLTLGAGELDGLLAGKARAYRELFDRGQILYAGAHDCVHRLAAQYRLAIASGSLRGEIVSILTAAGLLGPFRAIVGADDVAAGKPAPDSYLRAVALLGVLPGRSVAIEDSPWGLRSARAAGLRTIGITTSYSADALSDADLVVSSLDEVTVAGVGELIAR